MNDRAADAAEADLAVDELDPSRGRAGGVPRPGFMRPQPERRADAGSGVRRSTISSADVAETEASCDAESGVRLPRLSGRCVESRDWATSASVAVSATSPAFMFARASRHGANTPGSPGPGVLDETR